MPAKITSKSTPIAVLEPENLIGQRVLLFGLNYIYEGRLATITTDHFRLSDPSIVYETGPFDSDKYSDVQKLHTDTWFVNRAAVESFGLGK